jgi:hypothetical protein
MNLMLMTGQLWNAIHQVGALGAPRVLQRALDDPAQLDAHQNPPGAFGPETDAEDNKQTPWP